MVLKYDIEIQNNIIHSHLKKLTNQIYKLLPMREEAGEWEKFLQTLMEEFSGMERLTEDKFQKILFSLLCKLEGLFTLNNEEDFLLYRRVIFECLGLISELMKLCQG